MQDVKDEQKSVDSEAKLTKSTSTVTDSKITELKNKITTKALDVQLEILIKLKDQAKLNGGIDYIVGLSQALVNINYLLAK